MKEHEEEKEKTRNRRGRKRMGGVGRRGIKGVVGGGRRVGTRGGDRRSWRRWMKGEGAGGE